MSPERRAPADSSGEGRGAPPGRPPRGLAPELKEILACPRCKGELEFREAESEIRCLACRLAFRIDDGIPVMLLDEAKPIP